MLARSTLFFAVFLLWACSLLAQYSVGDREIVVSAGYLTGADIISRERSKTELDKAVLEKSPAFALQYKHYSTCFSTLGVGISYHPYSISGFRNGIPTRQDHQLVTACLEYKKIYDYLTFKYFQFYQTVSAGAGYDLSHPSQPWLFCMYLSPLGFRVGARHAFCLEFGWGYKGLVNGGYSLALMRKR